MAHDLHGYINVLKPPGWTSHDVVARLRRLSGQRRIGHAGTLDPAAIGVLPVALGRATRTTSSKAWDHKLYWADVQLGAATDTDDATGRVIATGSVESLTLDACSAALGRFVGDIQQRPPAYSAVHIGGGRAYAQARRGSVEPLPARAVRVESITIVAWRPPALSVLVQCGSGTYIRSIARDLGTALGCPAHLGALVRLRVGPFDIRDSVTLEGLAEMADGASWGRVLWPVDEAALDRDAIITGRKRADDFANGRAWTARGQADESTSTVVIDEASGNQRPHAARALGASPASPRGRGDVSLVRVYDEDGVFLGLAEPVDEMWQPRLAVPRLDPMAPPAAHQ